MSANMVSYFEMFVTKYSYIVKAAKKQETRFGSSYKLLVEDENNNYIVLE